jgi:chromosome segregation ATPase
MFLIFIKLQLNRLKVVDENENKSFLIYSIQFALNITFHYRIIISIFAKKEKENNMSYKFPILFIAVFALFTTSCVSKKKFLEMQTGRLQAEQQVRQLTQENNARAERIKAMIADFEAMKNELLESNAEKDQYIDNLNKEIAGLSNQLSQQKQSLQASTFTYGFEKERLAETLQAREKTIRSLESQVKELEKDISRQSSVLSDRNIRINVLNDQVAALELEKARGEKQQEELQQQMQKVRSEVNALRVQIKEKDETITRLQNNVNLLKKEIGG